jgi:hypothetical protein
MVRSMVSATLGWTAIVRPGKSDLSGCSIAAYPTQAGDPATRVGDEFIRDGVIAINSRNKLVAVEVGSLTQLSGAERGIRPARLGGLVGKRDRIRLSTSRWRRSVLGRRLGCRTDL